MLNRPSKAAIAPVGLIVALLAAITVSLWLLLPGGLLQAQDDSSSMYAENGTGAVATYTATDPEGTAITSWSLDGTDAEDFMIDNGVLTFAKPPNYEAAADANTDNTYEVTVEAKDSTGQTAVKEVMIKVTNVDEQGMVTLSALQPQAGTELTATLSDPDGGESDQGWQWSRSMEMDGTYTDIDKADSMAYRPTSSDTGYYLMAKVTYEDNEGAGKSAMMKSANAVQTIRSPNEPPKFADDQDPVAADDQAEAQRKVAENTAAGRTVGAPVRADAQDGDVLTYTLEGTDADSFDINWATGQILTKGALDAEATGAGEQTDDDGNKSYTYTVVVRATDPSGIPQAEGACAEDSTNCDVVTVMITVTNVNEPPVVSTTDTLEAFNEDTGIIDTALATYMADDPEEDEPITWSTSGADGSKFTIVDGALKFKEKPDYENPSDADMNNEYEVTVMATADGKAGTKAVKVEVENVDEDGTVTLNKNRPRVGIAVKASLTDPDGSISGVTWQWSIAGGAVTTDGGEIEGATSDTYIPKAGDVGGTLTATASYTDGHASGKTAMKDPANEVAADTRNKAPVFADQDTETDGVQNTMTTRKVEENRKANSADDNADDATGELDDNVGMVVTAEDPDPNTDPLIYTLVGADASKFRVRDNGQIEVASGTMLDYEGKKTYMVTVMAEDSFGATASIEVTIMVTPVDEMPTVTGDANIEYRENGTVRVASYRAVDPENAAITWSLGGTDEADFRISTSGVLTFAKSPNFEMAVGGGDGDNGGVSNTYTVIIQATDETMNEGTREVTVSVTDVDESGTVTLTALRPQVKTPLTATLTDPDGEESDEEWQWSRSRSKNGSYSRISNADAMTYTPASTDISYYLMAKVTYEDDQGAGKSAMMKSANAVQQIRSPNEPPKFADDQDPVEDGDQEVAPRKVAENTAAGRTVGAPVRADAQDGDVLTYTLEGTDADSFDINWATGQILTKGALDAEATGAGEQTDDDGNKSYTYTVVVRATDPSGIPQAEGACAEDSTNCDVVTVMITVTNVNEPPVVSTTDTLEAFNEDTGIIDTALATYMADDPEEDEPITWSTSGADGSKFTIVDGALKFKEKPDYENPSDADMNNEYEVTVMATADGKAGTKAVKVEVENVDEDGTVTLNRTRPRVGLAVKASLTDPDGSISKVTWQWSISAGAVTTDGGEIEGATSDTYIPKAGDDGGTLTATASYTDGHASGKTAMKDPANEVAADTRNKAPVFADQDTETDGVQNTMTTRKVEENRKANSADDNADDATGELDDNVGMVVTAEDPDPNEDPLTYTLTGADASKFRVRDNGQIEVASGTMLDYEGKKTYMVTVMAEDSFGATASIEVTIMVTDVDEAPEIMLGGLAISGMSSVDYAENGTDAVATYMAAGPDAAMAMWTLEGDDAGDFMISGGMLNFRNAPNFEKPADEGTDNTYMVTVKASDGTYMDTQDVTVTVTNVDELGMLDGPASVSDYAENGTDAVGTYTTDGPVTPTWSLEGDDVGDFMISSSGMLSFRSAPDYEMPADDDTDNTYMVTVKADAGGEMDTQNVTVTVTNVDELGMLDGPASVSDYAENGTDAVGTYTTDGPVTPTWSLEGDDMGDFMISSSGMLSFRSAPDYEMPADDDTDNTYMVTVKADAGGEIGRRDVTVTVTNVEEAPEFAMETAERRVAENTAAGVNIGAPVEATDPDIGDVLTYTLGGDDATSFDIDSATGQLMTKAALDYESKASYSVIVTATDPDGEAVSVDITITVTDVDERIGVSGSTASDYAENGTGPVATYTATDPAGETIEDGSITWSLEGDDAGDFDISAGGVLTFKNAPDYEAPVDADPDNIYEVTVKASDGTNENTVDVTVTVTNVNETPEISGPTASDYAENGTGPVATYTATDPEGEAIAWSLEGDDAGDFDISAGGVLTFKIAPDYEAPVDADPDNIYEVTVKASDGTNENTVDVTVTVTNVNETPEISGPTAADYAENGTGPVATYTATDPEGEAIAWSLEGDDAGDFDISAGGVLTFKGAPDYEAPVDADPDNIYEVTVKASDGTNEDTLDVTVTVTDVDDDPMTLLDRYDADDSGKIEQSEVIQAINDYLFGEGDDAITKDDAIEVINLYLFS